MGTTSDDERVFGDFQTTGHFISSGHVGSGHASYDEGAFVTGLLQGYSPDELKFIMIDPKQVQLTPYEGIPHLLRPIAYIPEEAESGVSVLLEEVDRRFDLFVKSGVKTIAEYNEKSNTKLPFITLLATEIADLMMVNRTFYEKAFISLAQKSKAVGIHMYLATQRPSADIITDMMAANIFGRLVFAVASEIDSRRLLNNNDAAQISKQGQLIYSDLTTGILTTVQAPYVSDATVVEIVDHIKGNLATR